MTDPGGEYAALVGRYRTDERVLGMVLTGSRARPDLVTAFSDHDLLLIGPDLTGEARRDSTVDIAAMSLEEFRAHAEPGSDSEWNRYAFEHCRVLKDSPDQLIAELAAAKARLGDDEAAALAPAALDGFLNFVYRSVKSERDGQDLAARLDAAEAIPSLLAYAFATHHRLRPYSKYLGWELEHHPLPEPVWRSGHLLPLLHQVLSPTPAYALRQLVTELEPLARRAGHGPVLDAWGDDLLMLRAA